MGKLVRLELFNFKSYKGHHVMLFGDSYFTSIIGPNGSGKSNSMDAISFVLGIKSSYLRSSHLRDLVHRGRVLQTGKIDANGDVQEQAEDEDAPAQTQRDDPTSAWVMAVYEDDAGDEHKWKRTVTNQGQSEYRINNKVVNAKQYNDALEDEGILIKARNFLVFQGDVESIANQSPKDLTRLVEQISGSLEYKAEYEKLEEQVDQAAEDLTTKLNQRRTINSEIKRFSEQKKEVDDYNVKAEERDDAVVTHVLWKLYHFQQTIEQSGAEITRLQEELKEHRRRIEAEEQRFEAARREQAKANRDVAAQERSIKRTEKTVVDKKDELIPIEEKLLQSQESLDKYDKRYAEIAKERNAQALAVKQLQKNIGTVQKAQSKWEAERSKVALQDGRQLSDADLVEYNKLKAEVNRHSADGQVRLENMNRQRTTDAETIRNFQSRIEDGERRLEILGAELQDLQDRKKETDNTVKQLSKELDEKKSEYNRLSSDRLKTEQKRTELDEKLAQILRKIMEADDGRRESEKEVRAKESLLAMKRMFGGVHGRVHELCRPKQKKYETAVSTVLGLNFDSIVVDTEKTARDCIEYMRQQKLGRPSFLPLDTIQVRTVDSKLRGIKGMRLAIDVVDYDNAYERAIAYACTNSMVCDDLATAKQLVYDRRIEAKAVTLDGTVLHKGGLMTGGRGPNDKGRKAWDDTELENLKRVKDKLMEDITTLPRVQQTITDEENLQNGLSGLKQRLAFAQDESGAFGKNLESKRREIAFVQSELKEVKPKYSRHNQDFATLQGKIASIAEQVGKVEDQIFASFCARLGYDNIRTYEAQQGSLQQEASQKKLEFSMQRTKLESQLTFENSRLTATEDRLKSLSTNRQRDADRIGALEKERENLQSQVDQAHAAAESLLDELDKLRKVHETKSTKVADVRRDVQRKSKEIDSATKNISSLEAEVQRSASSRYALLRKCKIDEIAVPLTGASRPLESLPVEEILPDAEGDLMDLDDPDVIVMEAPVVQDYGIDVDLDELDDDLKEENALQTIITNLTNELSTLTPNMRVVERLDAANDRLESTVDAFETARRLARDVRDQYEQLRAKRADVFNKAFAHISSQIAPIYQALTQSDNFPTGGKAYLDTMGSDEDKPFLGGIKYHAMPPLKRFRDMDALSGGEKTIAALALLFAIHSYAPSPFFVLDEVDAALDNTNVAKVARYIREHAGPGMQFIVISLKAALFQESECLVGILRDQAVNSSRAVTLDVSLGRGHADI